MELFGFFHLESELRVSKQGLNAPTNLWVSDRVRLYLFSRDICFLFFLFEKRPAFCWKGMRT